MHLAIFGASGGTGMLLTQRALAAGHTVTALLRTPGAFPLANEVTCVQGDATRRDDVLNTLTGADAVLSALGARTLRREEVLELAVPLIVDAMYEAGVRRIIALGSAGALDSALDKQPAWRRWIVENLVYKTALKWPVASQKAQYAVLAASKLDWTMVMPPMLNDKPAKGAIRIDGDALPVHAMQIARADVADFMFAQLSSDAWVRRGVYVSW